MYVLFMILMQLFDMKRFSIWWWQALTSLQEWSFQTNVRHTALFFYYYPACSQSSQRVMQVIAFPPHLCLCLAVQIKDLPKLFFRESDHQVGWCPSGCFNLMGTRLSHLASIVHPLFKLHDQPIFFSLLPQWSHLSPLTYPADVFWDVVSSRDFEHYSLEGLGCW